MSGESSNSGFSLTGGGSGFSSRSDDIFAGLGNLEKKHFAKERAKEKFGRDIPGRYVKDDPVNDPTDPIPGQRKRPWASSQSRPGGSNQSCYSPSRSGKSSNPEKSLVKSDRRETSQRRKDDEPGTSFNFKPPRARAPRPRKVPDYKQHPDAWTRYDLSDVSTDQMSDRTNSAAALQFLQERQVLRENSENEDKQSRYSLDYENKDDETERADSFKPVFNRALKSKESTSSNDKGDEKSVMVGGKLTMPEYVVGVKKIKRKSNKTKKRVAAGDRVELGHLDDEEEEYSSDNLSDLSDLTDEEMERDNKHETKTTGDKTDKNGQDKKLEAKTVEEKSDKSGEQGQNADSSIKETETDVDAVKFKSRKGKKRGIRKRDDSDED